MTYVGGLRARLIRDSVFHAIDDALRALGWYEPGAHKPVRMVAEAVNVELEIPVNTVALGDEDQAGEAAEMGSHLTERTWAMWVDFYGENDAISLHMIRDVADILGGALPSVGRGRPVVDVFDYTLATPAVLFVVEIENVRTDRAHGFGQTWLAYWRSCQFTVVDTYDNENVADPTPPFDGYGGY